MMVGNPPRGSASPGGCGRPGPPVLAPRKRGQQAGAKNGCENCIVNDDVSVFTLIRTDTTLDLSQKAEKVCIIGCMHSFLLSKTTNPQVNLFIV